MEELKNRILALLELKALTVDEKAEVRGMCKEAGVEVKFGTRCKNCYHDALVLLYKHYSPEEEKEEEGIPTPSGNYLYKGGNRRVFWYRKGLKYTLNNLAEDKAIELYIAENPEQTLYTQRKETPND